MGFLLKAKQDEGEYESVVMGMILVVLNSAVMIIGAYLALKALPSFQSIIGKFKCCCKKKNNKKDDHDEKEMQQSTSSSLTKVVPKE